MERTTRILVVDDQVLYREGLRELIGHWSEFEVSGEASNGVEAIELCKVSVPDVVLMDIQMPVMGGVEAASIIAREYPQVIVIMLSVGVDDGTMLGAFGAGARGYILKDMPSRQLRNRLRGAVKGEAALSGAVATRMIERFGRQLQTSSEVRNASMVEKGLTERELQIVRLVADGLSNDEIGARLYLSSGTVKKQLRNIMQIYGFENRVQIAAFAIRSGIA